MIWKGFGILKRKVLSFCIGHDLTDIFEVRRLSLQRYYDRETVISSINLKGLFAIFANYVTLSLDFLPAKN